MNLSNKKNNFLALVENLLLKNYFIFNHKNFNNIALKLSPKKFQKSFFLLVTLLCFLILLLYSLSFSSYFNNQFSFLLCKNLCLNNRREPIANLFENRNLPHCIIIGARKCGTRALLEFLDIHPQIIKVTNEIHFFDDENKYNLGLEWYRKQMPITNTSSSLPKTIVIEKTPAYFVTESVPERIYAMNSSIKIILIVRDPVTRLISDYVQLASNKAKKDRSVQSFEQVVLFPNGKVNSSYKGIRISMYAVYFLRWIKLFSKNQIHIVDGDHFVYDPLPELRKIETFLGLSHEIGYNNFIYNVTKGFYCIRILNHGEKCLNKSKGRRHPEINPLVIRKLRKFYEPYNKYFFQLSGKIFQWPN